MKTINLILLTWMLFFVSILNLSAQGKDWVEENYPCFQRLHHNDGVDYKHDKFALIASNGTDYFIVMDEAVDIAKGNP